MPSDTADQILTPELFDQGAVVRELVNRGGLREFIEIFWSAAEPRSFVGGWHIDAVCDHLEAVLCGDIKRLVICQPPGTMKSLCVGVFWPAYMWTLDPTISTLYGSFDQTLLNNQSEKMLSIIQSEQYQSAYGDLYQLKAKNPALREFKNTSGGFRFNTSPSGKGTGRHVDGAVVDDPLKPQDAINLSEAAFKEVDAWYDGTLQTRVRKWLTIIMQRLHENDLAGRCIAEGYTPLILPMRQIKRSMWARDPRTEPGELLWPNNPRYTEEEVENLERKLALQGQASAQLQQDPTPATGGFVEERWCRLEWVEPPTKGVWVQSWDFSSKGTLESHSKVSGQLWCKTRDMKVAREYISTLDERLAKVKGSASDFRMISLPDRSEMFVLVDWVSGHWNFPASKAQFAMAQERPMWRNARVKLIELKANGPAIIDEMKSKFSGIIGVEPEGTKEERYRVHTEKWECAQVIYPPGGRTEGKKEYWVGADAVREEHIKFPRFTWDDHVDTTTQALDRLTGGHHAYRENLAKIAGRVR
jgi:phage terminase large subunit-like protein